jgi:ABC-type multidrug transport system ATPase subunit
MYCSQFPLSRHNGGGMCQSCWKCCIFPYIHGNCPSRCLCDINKKCYERDDITRCGQGLECKSGKCEPVTEKYEEAFQLYESEMVKSDVKAKQIARGFSHFDSRCALSGDNRFLMSSNTTRVTNPDCPCFFGILKCPSGYKCSSVANNTILEFESSEDPLLWATGKQCVPCAIGEFCPTGTESEAGVVFNSCPQGAFCPTTSIKKPCAPGSFCRSNTIIAQQCETQELLFTNEQLLIKEPLVLDYVVRGSLPYKGNYCPANSTDPLRLCPSGSYCPNTSIAIICPMGHYCKEGSTYPQPCRFLSYCPIGTISQPWNWMCLVFILGLFSFIGICTLVRKWNNVINLFKGFKSKNRFDGMVITDEDRIYAAAVEADVNSDQVGVEIAFDLREVLGQGAQCNDVSIDHSIQNLIYNRRLSGLQVLNLSVQQNTKSKPWLWPISCRFIPNAVNAIMGASGCGKSTLLDVLHGHLPSAIVSGMINVKGTAYGDITVDLPSIAKMKGSVELSVLKKMHAHVPQDDVCCPDLTVEENIKYSLLLHAKHIEPLKWKNHKHIGGVTEYIVNSLQLADICHNIVGSVDQRGISGGQRKRVSIGMAMVTLPSLLLMDEPTSGLDSTGTNELLKLCGKLSGGGITIVMIIHQPRYTSFMMVDELLLLSKYGAIFFGSPSMAILYFQRGLKYTIDINENPADAIIDIVSHDQKALADKWKGQCTGYNWVNRCNLKNPMLHDACKLEILYDQQIQTIITLLMRDCSYNLIIDGCNCLAYQISSLFTTFKIKHDLKSIYIFVQVLQSKYLTKEPDVMHFLLAVQHICETVTLQKSYDNVLERINLFNDVPDPLTSTTNGATSLRVTFLARKFITKLLHIAGLEENHDKNTIFILEKEILLTVLYLRHKIALALENPLQVVDNIDYAALESHAFQSIKHYICEVYILVIRRALSIWRSPWGIQLVLPMCAALIVGYIHGSDWGAMKFPNNVVMAFACIGVLSTITHIRTFALDKLIMRRDIAGRVSVLAYFTAYNLTDVMWILCMPLTFCVPYVLMTAPMCGFGPFYAIGLLICWWTSGVAYLLATVPVALHWLNIIAAFVAVIFGAFLNGLSPTIASVNGTFLESIFNLSYNRWAMEYITINEFSHEYYQRTNANQVWAIFESIGLCGMGTNKKDKYNNILGIMGLYQKIIDKNNVVIAECDDYMKTSVYVLISLGTAFRFLACSIMMMQNNMVLNRILWRMSLRG